VLNHTPDWVDAGSRDFYASAMRAPTHIKPLDDFNQTARSYLIGRSGTAATEGPLLKSAPAADRHRHRSWRLRRSLMFSALFHPSSHSGFGPTEIWTCFRIGALHIHPEMVFVSTYSIYRRSLNG